MAATINADNGVVSGSAGVKTTADTSGVLALQSNGTTGLTLNTSLALGVGSGNATGSAGQFLTSAGSAAPPTWSTLTTSSVTQSVINTSTAAVAGTYYLITATLTLTLPASPTAGQFVAFSNISGTTTPVIARNGLNIMALAENMTLNSAQARGLLVYTDATNGWVLFND